MEITTESFKTKTGKTIVLRSPRTVDARQMRSYLISVAETAPYIFSTVEDIRQRPEDAEIKWIEKYGTDPRDLLIFAEYEGKIVGNIEFSCGARFKNFHRGHIGMSVLPEMRGEGIGEILIRKLFAESKKVDGLTQIELSVMHPNTPAYNLYKKTGFQECGRKPNAFKLQDGTFADEIAMYFAL